MCVEDPFLQIQPHMALQVTHFPYSSLIEIIILQNMLYSYFDHQANFLNVADHEFPFM